ncbi:hypothetical protein [Serratia sp. MMO-24]
MQSDKIIRNYVPYPNHPGDKGQYFIDINSITKDINGHITLISKRVGIDYTGYTLIKIDCNAKKYKELGYSEIDEESITLHKDASSQEWVDLVDGSSKYYLILNMQLYDEEFNRLSIENTAFINFLSQIEELRDNIPDSPSSMTLKMNYSFSVTLMESCLGDMLKHAILNEKIFLSNALRNVEELKQKKVSLLEVYEIDDLVKKYVLSVLSDYLYHNIAKIVPVYNCVFNEKLPSIIYDRMKNIIKIVRIRHDIVHRNGFDKDGNEHKLTNENLKVTIQNIIDFVQSMNMYIETAKKKLTFSQNHQPLF